MSKRPARPPGTPWLSPCLIVKDADAALDFYQRAFGFEKRMVVPGPDGRTCHAEVVWQDALIMISPEVGPGCKARTPATSGIETPVGLYVYCDDVDAVYTRATKAGAKSVMPPQDMFWGDRMCNVQDPDGHSWSFATNVGDCDLSKMPQ
jgi:PhnB protein